MAVPGEKATFVGSEDRPDVTSAPRVVMGGSGATEPGGDRVKKFLDELGALDVRQLSGQSGEPGGDEEDDEDGGPGPHKTSPDLAKFQSDHYKTTIDTILYSLGGEQLDEVGMSNLLDSFALSDQDVHENLETLWEKSASAKE
ncbi:MAG TPA: hypothetical protein VFW96_25205 [Thermomicrobiales bacterium]|nr:hypothetical protein [Thermomicrobiales bacterium]